MTDEPVILLEDARVAWGASGRESFSLRIPSFRLEAREHAALVGASGGGKSTLLALLSGVADGSGRVEVCGAALTALSGAARDRWRADHVGLVFQLFNLLPAASVLDNILLPLDFSRRRRERLAARGVAPTEEARRLITALALPVELADTPAGELSVGQQQRVAAARALIGEPELVLADEPTSALDPEARDRFLELLFAEVDRAGAAVLLVTHDPGVAARFERVERLAEIAHAERPAAARAMSS